MCKQIISGMVMLILGIGLPIGVVSAQSCTVSTDPVNFDVYNPFQVAPLDSTGTVHINCNSLITISINYGIQMSTGNSGSFSNRIMSSGAHHLNYNLYTDPGRTAVWGDGSAGTSIVTGSVLCVLNCSVPHTVYGRIPGSQTTAAVGSYTDIITVTVNY